MELEKLRSALATAAAERHATHAGLVQRRFDAIAETGQLLRFHQRVARLVQPVELAGGPSREQRAKEVADTFSTFDDANQDQKIFLSRRTADRIDAIRQTLVSSTNLFNLVVARQQNAAEQWIQIEQRVS